MSAAIEAVGVELIEMPRFARALERHGVRLASRVFTDAERAYAARKRDGTHNLAARFAAKCAGRRALRAAGRGAVSLREVEVVRRRSGEPTLTVHGGAGEGLRFHLTLSHDADFALASLWIERR